MLTIGLFLALSAQSATFEFVGDTEALVALAAAGDSPKLSVAPPLRDVIILVRTRGTEPDRSFIKRSLPRVLGARWLRQHDNSEILVTDEVAGRLAEERRRNLIRNATASFQRDWPSEGAGIEQKTRDWLEKWDEDPTTDVPRLFSALCLSNLSEIAVDRRFTALGPYSCLTYSNRPSPAELAFPETQGLVVRRLSEQWDRLVGKAVEIAATKGRSLAWAAALGRVAFCCAQAPRALHLSVRGYSVDGSVLFAGDRTFALDLGLPEVRLSESVVQAGSPIGTGVDPWFEPNPPKEWEPARYTAAPMLLRVAGSDNVCSVIPDRFLTAVSKQTGPVSAARLASVLWGSGVVLEYVDDELVGRYADPVIPIGMACVRRRALRSYCTTLASGSADVVRSYGELCVSAGPAVRISDLDDAALSIGAEKFPNYPEVSIGFRFGFLLGELDQSEYTRFLQGRTIEIRKLTSIEHVRRWLQNEFECLSFPGVEVRDVRRVGTFETPRGPQGTLSLKFEGGAGYYFKGSGMVRPAPLSALADYLRPLVPNPTVEAADHYLRTARSLQIAPPFDLFTRPAGPVRVFVTERACLEQQQSFGTLREVSKGVLPNGFVDDAKRALEGLMRGSGG